MRKFVFLLVVVLFGFQAFGEKGEPILPYGNYSIEEVRAFALSPSKKAEEFREVLVPLVQRKLNESGESLVLSKSHISWIFDQVVEQEAWLEARQFKNSRWMPDNKTIDFYISETRYEGATGIFVYGKCSFPLYKVSCANLLDASLNRATSSRVVEHNILKIDTIRRTYEKVDTSYVTVWVEEPQYVENRRVETVYVEQLRLYDEPIYRPMFMPVFIPVVLPRWGSNYNNVCVNNSNYYSSNTVINNTNINNHIVNKDNGGGPAGVPGHDAGGPAGVPGHDAGSSNEGGPSGAGGFEANPTTGGPSGSDGFNARSSSRSINSSLTTKSASTRSGGNTNTSSSTSGRRISSSATSGNRSIPTKSGNVRSANSSYRNMVSRSPSQSRSYRANNSAPRSYGGSSIRSSGSSYRNSGGGSRGYSGGGSRSGGGSSSGRR